MPTKTLLALILGHRLRILTLLAAVSNQIFPTGREGDGVDRLPRPAEPAGGNLFLVGLPAKRSWLPWTRASALRWSASSTTRRTRMLWSMSAAMDDSAPKATDSGLQVIWDLQYMLIVVSYSST